MFLSFQSGDIDFWPNTGYSQPGCRSAILNEVFHDLAGCSHSRATTLYLNSILEKCMYESHNCREGFLNEGPKRLPRMGLYAEGKADVTKRCLITAGEEPFCEI